MVNVFTSKTIVILLMTFCVSCSSSGQSVQPPTKLDETDAKTLRVGIQNTATQLVLFYVVNNTTSDITMLRWNTPFEKTLSADIFLVMRGEEKMSYLGRKVKRGNPDSDDYLLIPAGRKIESTIDIGKYYGLSEPGEYTVSINLPAIDGLSRFNQHTSVQIESGTANIVVTR